ncbi:hypothetical protein SAZ_36710 [Streptomyces noursei ZPM]|nr:hypothetical protein SAZ_36710 [Streptomyces noursei ZPM]EXU90646.1 hypothetical protein P354_13540 [Streptomyces noursei PD-1]
MPARGNASRHPRPHAAAVDRRAPSPLRRGTSPGSRAAHRSRPDARPDAAMSRHPSPWNSTRVRRPSRAAAGPVLAAKAHRNNFPAAGTGAHSGGLRRTHGVSCSVVGAVGGRGGVARAGQFHQCCGGRRARELSERERGECGRVVGEGDAQPPGGVWGGGHLGQGGFQGAGQGR